MKKNLLIMLCMLFCLSGAKADSVRYDNVEIDGFIYNLDDNESSDSNPSSGYADLIGITDSRYAEVCSTQELSVPSSVAYKDNTYQIIALRSSFFEDKDFQSLESINLGNLLAITYALNNLPNLKSITGGNIEAYIECVTELPSLSNLQLGMSDRVPANFRNSFNGIGIECLNFPKDATIARVENSFRHLPNVVEIDLCESENVDYSFREMPSLREITFEYPPYTTKNSFSDLPALEKITFKKWNDRNLVKIEFDAFADNPMLKDVFVEERTPCEMKYDSRTFPGSEGFKPQTMTLHVPAGSRELYAAAEGWKDFGEIVEYDAPGAGVETAEADATQPWSCTPAAGGLTVSADNAVTVEVVTPAGAVVKRVAMATGETVTVELPAGVYIVAGPGQSAKVCVR
ncbi:MAG: hypothetical protein HDS68_10225 [Bacteroidales bacterium]|nr:hypothetical protein [Bacteroidales bacterium]